MGSAYHNKGVQLLLDAICDYSPSPYDVDYNAFDTSDGDNKIQLYSDHKKEFVGLAFKLEEGTHGLLTYIRVYQGCISKGMNLFNVRSGKKIRSGRLVRMHSDEMTEIQSARSGEICAAVGIECSSGDTLTEGSTLAMSPIHASPPVVSLGLTVDKKQVTKLSKALNRFQREDLTFHVEFNDDTREINISGMGELHLEIYVERIKREYGIICETGKPQVSFRETMLDTVHFDHLHKKQSGGAGQYAKITGYIEHIPMDSVPVNGSDNLEFVNKIIGNALSPSFITSVEKVSKYYIIPNKECDDIAIYRHIFTFTGLHERL